MSKNQDLPHIQYHNPESPKTSLPEDFPLKEDEGIPCYPLFGGKNFKKSENLKLFKAKLKITFGWFHVIYFQIVLP